VNVTTIELIETVRSHLNTVLKPIDFDITEGPGENELDISTDDWTIHLEGAWGFIAVDEEPEESAAFLKARRAAMSEQVERAIAAADRELGGALSDALSVSADPFTLDFVAALARHHLPASPG
jgi:hypothetical protein